MSNSTKSTLIVATLSALLIFFIWGLGSARLPLMISFALAYLVFPVIKRLETKGVRRQWAVLGVFLVSTLFSISILALMLPSLWADARDLARELPMIASRSLERVESMAQSLGLNLGLSDGELRGYLETHLSDLSGSVVKGITGSVREVFTNSVRWILALLNLFLIPLFFFYVINDFERISSELKSFIPKSISPRLGHYLRLSNRVLSGYIRGQLIVALILGALYSSGLMLVGLRFGLLIGLVTGLVSIIPYVGFTLGFMTSLMVAFTHASGWGVVFGVVAVFLTVQALEGTVITPKFVGDQVGLRALPTILAIIVGGNVLGLTGIMIAIPTAAVLKSILWDLKDEYQKLEIYQ